MAVVVLEKDTEQLPRNVHVHPQAIQNELDYVLYKKMAIDSKVLIHTNLLCVS